VSSDTLVDAMATSTTSTPRANRSGSPDAVIRTRGLTKVYPGGLKAVDALDLSVEPGEIFGLLGPNGAGKTTTVGMLTTRIIPTAGSAMVGGVDVVLHPALAKQAIGVVPQTNTLDRSLSVWENLYYHGRYFGMGSRESRRRADQILEQFRLSDRSKSEVQQLSGGMAQRLMVARAIVHSPHILFLDEPSIGLDPAAAVDLRNAIAGLVPEHTVLLTTHDMAEADVLCREIAIVDKGLIVAQGTPQQLKARVAGSRRIVVSSASAVDGQMGRIEAELNRLPGVRGLSGETVDGGRREWTILCTSTTSTLDSTLAVLRQFDTPISGISVFEPTLEDAFLAIAGRSFE